MTNSEPTTPDLEPVEHAPEDIVVHDTERRRWTVHTATTGAVVVVRARSSHRNTRDRVVTVLDQDNARGLSDALEWAARCRPVIPEVLPGPRNST